MAGSDGWIGGWREAGGSLLFMSLSLPASIWRVC